MLQDRSSRRRLTVSRRFDRAPLSVAAVVLASLLGGCVTDANVATNGANDRATLAFESIDGPPQPVFERLVAQIDSQAEAHRLAVVSREGEARYHVRAYLATIVNRGKSVLNWVWDVYDSDGQRVQRLAGAEPLSGSPGSDAWAQAGDAALAHIAATGVSGLAALTGNANPEPATAASAAAPAAKPEPQPAQDESTPPAVRVATASPSTAAANAISP